MDNRTNNSPQRNWPKNNGMTVPNGYFEDFAARMMAQIPEESIKHSTAPKRTVWQIIKPYAYMAALFAGAYLMLNIFSIGSRLHTNIPSGEQMQELLADVVNINTTTYLEDYISLSDCEVYDKLFDEGFEIPETY